MHQFRNTLHNAPACERSLNRHRYHNFRKCFSIQRRITAKVFEMLICFFYRKFNKPCFLSEQFSCISFRGIGEPLKKCTFFPRLRLERSRLWRGLLICSMGSRIKHKYRDSDLYRLMLLFVENWSNLTGILTHQYLPNTKMYFSFLLIT